MTAVSPTLPVLPAVRLNDVPRPEAQTPPDAQPHQGMPPLETDGPALSFFEFWPM